MQQHRNRNIIRQVRHQGGGFRTGDDLDVKGVGQDDFQPLGSTRHSFSDGTGKLVGQHLVNLDGNDLRAGLQQPQGERTQPGADFDNSVCGAHLRQGNYPAHRVSVVDEILPASLCRSQTDLVSNAPDRRRVEQAGFTHQAPPYAAKAFSVSC